ncbi:MAG: hypothetical protein P4M10_08475 [Verrucomicrobiae bacterium]|nr:hypothetical protein [Verrucomicrobiae bacterium]
MSAAPLPAPISAFAPAFSRRLAHILSTLAAIVARRFLRHPGLIPLIVPLWTRLTRTAHRVERLMASLAAGRLPRPRRSGPSTPHRIAPASNGVALPAGPGWLVRVLGSEAAICASQLESLLAEPEAAGLLARVPTVARILRPIARMIAPDALGAPAPRATRRAPPPGPCREPSFRPPDLSWSAPFANAP